MEANEYKAAVEAATDKIRLGQLIQELRQGGTVGWIESRDWLAVVFPEFAGIRDPELDAILEKYANDMMTPRIEREPFDNPHAD